MVQSTVPTRYAQLVVEREPYVTRARAAASLTIPSTFPPSEANGSTSLPTPYQGFGARALKALTAKIALAMLPANSPFFRLMVSEADLADSSEETRGKVEESLAAIERLVVQELESLKLRPIMNSSMMQLLVAGNVLLYVGADGAKFYRLDKYVVKRNGFGEPVEIIIKEQISKDNIPAHIRAKVLEDVDQTQKTFDLYTVVKRKGSKWRRHQEIKGHVLPETRATYQKDRCPYLPLRLVVMDGEDYGRGYVEEHIGDLHSLENLTKAIVEAALASAKIIWLVNPNGTTKTSNLNKAKNGDFVAGIREEIDALQLDKFADLSVARQTAVEMEQGLAQAFLMNTSVQRDAERVTAQEIRVVSQELETILGGVYSLLSEELQLPLVNVIIGRLTASGDLPALPKDTLKPRVITGLDGLGRGQDIQRLQGFISGISQLVGPEAVANVLNLPEFCSRWAAAWSVDSKDLVKTSEELNQNNQQNVNMQLLQSLGPDLLKQMQASQGNPNG
ncbi:hypothetical protein BFS86_09105 [Shewanella algae]|nr:hypothetical protein BFS86_09105 [Shewanella algae]